MRHHYNTSATVKRLGAYSNNKASYGAVAGTIRGFFNPIEPSKRTDSLGIVGQAYEFVTDGHKDIRENDKLTISSGDYPVKGVMRHTIGSTDILKVTLGKPNAA